MQKDSEIGECNSGEGNKDNSKKGKEEEKEGNRHSHYMWSPPTFQPWLRLRSYCWTQSNRLRGSLIGPA